MYSKLLFFCLILSISCSCHSQYINRLIVPGEDAVTLSDIYSLESGYYLTYLYANQNTASGGISELTLGGDISDKLLFPNIRIAKNGLSNIEEKNIYFGKVTGLESNLTLLEFSLQDNDFTIIESLDIQGCLTFPFLSLRFDESLFLGYSCTTFDPDHRDYGLLNYHPESGIKFNNRFNRHIVRSNIAAMDTIGDNVVIASKRQNFSDDVAFLLKLDTTGEIIDSFQSDFQINDFNDRVFMTVLSDDLLVIGYRIDEPGDDVPIQLEFLDAELNKVAENRIFNTLLMRITPTAFLRGRGDYFFCYGSFIDYDIDEGFGYIAKLDFDGNVIWQHKYQHPDYSLVDDYNGLSSLIEEDNGDLTAIGNILRLGDPFTGWMIRVNEQGCFGNEACDEIVVDVNVNDFVSGQSTVTIFPNPSIDQLIVRSQEIKIDRISIYDSNSTLVNQQTANSSEMLIDISSYPKGWYVITISLGNGEFYTKKIMKP